MTATESGAAQDAQPSSGAAAKRGDKLGAWTVVALLLGIAGDLVEPLGNVAIWLLTAGFGVLVLCFVLAGRLSIAKRGRLHSAIFVAIMAGVVVLQQTAPEKEKADNRGATVTYLPFLGSIQTSLLSSRLSGAELALFRFQDALASAGDDIARAASARELYDATEDAALRRGMLNAMMDSGDPALQQTAILLRLNERSGERLQLLPVDRNADDPLSRRLLSFSFEVRRVNVDSGSLRLFGDGRGSDGTVALQGIEMPLAIVIGERERQWMQVDLQPGEGRTLQGTVRLESGEAVAVEMPLF